MRGSGKIKLIFFLWLFFCLSGFIFIRCHKVDEAGLIRETLRSAVRAAEKKETAKILRVLDDEYRDFENRDVKATGELLEYYFKRYYGIVIHLLEVEVQIDGDVAEVRADILFSSGPLETLRKTIGLVGSFYQFEIKMAKRSGGWKIKYARWWEAEENSLLPGSRAILKKLFPDIF